MTARLGACGCLLLLLTVLALSLHIPGELGIGSDERMAVFVALACVAGVVYAGAVWLVLRHRFSGSAIWVILAVALLLRLMVVISPSFLSSDLFRYVWDGRVQVAGINPYRYVPADPALAFLRDTAIFPHINRADYAPTIYPPVAQAVFLAVASLSPTVQAMKLAMTGFDLVTMAAVAGLLGAAGLPRERLLIYAWHPLPIWEFAGSAHVDAIAIALITLAMLLHLRRSVWAGALLAAAVLVKFLPAVVLPAFWRRWDLGFLVVFCVVIAGAYLCYIGAGWQVFGFLGGYAAEEGLATGGGLYPVFALGRFVDLPLFAGKIYLAMLAALLGGLALWMVLSSADPWDPRRLASRVLLLTTVVTVGLSPHYPWYFCWLLPASCVVPCWCVLYLSLASFLIYLNPIHTELLWPSVVYLPFGLIAAAELFLRRSPDAVPALFSGRS